MTDEDLRSGRSQSEIIGSPQEPSLVLRQISGQLWEKQRRVGAAELSEWGSWTQMMMTQTEVVRAAKGVEGQRVLETAESS